MQWSVPCRLGIYAAIKPPIIVDCPFAVRGMWHNTRSNDLANLHVYSHGNADNVADIDSFADRNTIRNSDTYRDCNGNGDGYTIPNRSSDQHPNADF